MERRKFTPQFKTQVVLKLLSGAKTLAQACCACGPGAHPYADREWLPGECSLSGGGTSPEHLSEGRG